MLLRAQTMSGNKEGARKAREKILAKDPDFYAKIGAKSWSNPKRSHETGFALMPEELRKELGAKGGRKTKKEYKTGVTNRHIIKIFKALEESPTTPETDKNRTGTGE